jgi:hypothetical protein
VLFVALFFFYAGGLVGNYPWSFLAHTSTSLSSVRFFIGIASALSNFAVCARGLAVEDARRTHSREHTAHLSHGQTAGFAAPAALAPAQSSTLKFWVNPLPKSTVAPPIFFRV